MGARGSTWVALATVAVVTLGATSSRAGTPEDAIHVESGMCIEPAPLVHRVTMWLRGSNVDPHVRVDVTASKEAKEVLFVVRRGQSLIGKKTMRADELTCSEFEAAVALAIASALEAVVPAALEPNAVTSPIIAATAPPSSALAPPVVAAVEGVKRAPFRHRVALGAELATAAGYLMAPAALLSPSLELRVLERFDLRLAIALTADQSRALGTGIVTMQTAFGALSACYVVLTSPSPVRLRGCVGLSVGGTGAEAHGYLTNSAAIAPWAGLDAGLDVRWPADAPLALIVGLRGDVVAVPPTFAVEAVGVVRTNPVAGGGFVGLQLVLPP